MVYGILLMINFAHGELFMIGAYVGWGVLIWLINAELGGLHPAWVVPVMLLMAMSVSGHRWAWRWSASPTGRCTRAARPAWDR